VSEDKKVFNEIKLVMAILAGIAIVIGLVAGGLIDDDHNADASWKEKKTLERIQPMGQVATTKAEAEKATPKQEPAPVPVAKGPQTAEQIYNQACMACHGTGAAGAPKVGDAAAWAPRIAQGAEVLFEHATKGFKGMPPKGGSPNLTDEEIQKVVDYMVSNSQ
jgi:cytochrome c5